MKSFITSYTSLFGLRDDGSSVSRIEVPLIQRDYAQGREGATVERIRVGFLQALHRALTTGEPLHLDFVYGDVRDGVLRPLDGQQRLTTLFLLHWYLAHRVGTLDAQAPWSAFGYAVRPTARLFCKRLVANCRPPANDEHISAWIQDQQWHLYTWQQDPTIRAMLVMLDAIHERFRHDDCRAAWARLVDTDTPLITFHVLLMEEVGRGDELYIKMNSRGKPLTAFENFKAMFEREVARSCPARVDELAFKIDGTWSDVFWPYRGDDNIIDDEFMRYMHFVSSVCAWRAGAQPRGGAEELPFEVFGAHNPDAEAQLDFLFGAFDAWQGVDVASEFSSVFSRVHQPGRVVLFGTPEASDTDLFAQCCATFGVMQGKRPVFGIQRTLLLYGMLLHRIEKTESFSERARVVRNLADASGNELRAERMPHLIAHVGAIVRHGTLDNVGTFSAAQVEQERAKARFRVDHPEIVESLFELEDHPVLRGNLAAFELDIATFERRARLFPRVFAQEHWPQLTAALLTHGDYARPWGSQYYRFGSGAEQQPWAEVFLGNNVAKQESLRRVLAALLDQIDEQADLAEELARIRHEWLAATETEEALDWRYYLTKYDAMREGASGVYVTDEEEMGYRICMLRTLYITGYYRDPYLLAVHRASGVGEAVKDTWFRYLTPERWMPLKRSGAAIRCVNEGFLVRPPTAGLREAFDKACGTHAVDQDGLLRVAQREQNRRMLDTQDRVQLAASLIRSLVDAGL